MSIRACWFAGMDYYFGLWSQNFMPLGCTLRLYTWAGWTFESKSCGRYSLGSQCAQLRCTTINCVTHRNTDTWQSTGRISWKQVSFPRFYNFLWFHSPDFWAVYKYICVSSRNRYIWGLNWRKWHCFLDEDNMKWIKSSLFKRLVGKHSKYTPISSILFLYSLGICQHASRRHLEYSVLKSSQFRPDLVFTKPLQYMNIHEYTYHFDSLKALGHEAPHSTTQRCPKKNP